MWASWVQPIWSDDSPENCLTDCPKSVDLSKPCEFKVKYVISFVRGNYNCAASLRKRFIACGRDCDQIVIIRTLSSKRWITMKNCLCWIICAGHVNIRECMVNLLWLSATSHANNIKSRETDHVNGLNLAVVNA